MCMRVVHEQYHLTALIIGFVLIITASLTPTILQEQAISRAEAREVCVCKHFPVLHTETDNP